MFFACSTACLVEHQRKVHPDVEADTSRGHAVRAVAGLNATTSPFEAYRTHRDRLARLCRAVQRGAGLCVLGAGNGDTLDLPLLVREFGEVHLVDIDGAALERAAARVEERVRAHLHTRADMDLGGLLDRIDELAVSVPDPPALADLARQAAERVSDAIARTFDVVVSDCVLSQLPFPFRDALLLTADEWSRLQPAVFGAHLRAMAGLVRPGGTGLLVCDVLSSQDEPALLRYASPDSWSALGTELAQKIGHGALTLDPDPAQLLGLLSAPALSSLVDRPRLTEPWTWDLGDGLQLVCAILWNRPDEPVDGPGG